MQSDCARLDPEPDQPHVLNAILQYQEWRKCRSACSSLSAIPVHAGAARRLRRLLQAPAAGASAAPMWQAVFLITAKPVDVPTIAQSVRARTLPGKFEQELAASGANCHS